MGKASDLRSRVSSYFSPSVSGEKTRALVLRIDKVDVTVVESELESLLLEAAYIKKYNPRFNIRLTDGKAYPLIRITFSDSYPKVLTARRPDDPKSIYFGPFPNVSAVRMVLRLVRRIFSYVSVANHAKRICLYHHLGLCPCPPVFDSPQLKKEYRRNIRRIITFLNGKKEIVLRELEKEKKQLVAAEAFEDASTLQQTIDAIHYVTTQTRKPFEYETNPNLSEDLRREETSSLINVLLSFNVPVSKLSKIECYDISNIQGASAVGSLVVFTNGEKNTDLYRRFRIYGKKTPDDFFMMREVLKRRFSHPEWEYPNLIIVDGGKGQISAACEVIDSLGISVPVIGLAKREETLITSDFKEISLSKNSPALRLCMRIRDEAHRFALAYHKKLRTKFTFL